MSEQERPDSPLVSERGTTIISDTVVSTVAGMAAHEVEGVHMGGSAARTAGGFLSNITGSESQTRGVSVEVGTMEVAIDLTLGVEYGRNILQTVEEVRRRISERVQSMTGLRVTELNTTVSDIVFPEDGGRRRSALEAGSSTETPTLDRERETTAASPLSRTHVEGASGPVPEEETRAGGRQPEEDETAEIRTGDVDEARRASGDSEETTRQNRRRQES